MGLFFFQFSKLFNNTESILIIHTHSCQNSFSWYKAKVISCIFTKDEIAFNSCLYKKS